MNSMLSERLRNAIYLSSKISRYFGGSPLEFNKATLQMSIDKSSVFRLHRNFSSALIWQVLSFILVLKRSKNNTNLDEFFLTFAWWIGYSLAVLAYSVSRFQAAGLCDTTNGLINLLRVIRGKC